MTLKNKNWVRIRNQNPETEEFEIEMKIKNQNWVRIRNQKTEISNWRIWNWNENQKPKLS